MLIFPFTRFCFNLEDKTFQVSIVLHFGSFRFLKIRVICNLEYL